MKKKTIEKRRISRECWNLDQTFLEWLRIRLPVFLKENIIDFEQDHGYEYNGKLYRQDELIQIMIDDLKIADVYDTCDKEYEVAVNEILEIWKTVFHGMWW